MRVIALTIVKVMFVSFFVVLFFYLFTFVLFPSPLIFIKGKIISNDEAIALFIEKNSEALQSQRIKMKELLLGNNLFQIEHYSSPTNRNFFEENNTVLWQFSGIDDSPNKGVVRILPSNNDVSIFSSLKIGQFIMITRNNLEKERWVIKNIATTRYDFLNQELINKDENKFVLIIIFSKNSENVYYNVVSLEKVMEN